MTEQFHIGKRIKFFREYRCLTQKQLGQESGIIEATIRKYEIGQRNPKSDQIAKIAAALSVTPNALAPPEIKTDADVISLILAIDDIIGIAFDGKKNSKGKIDTRTLTLHIENIFVNDSLTRWGNAKNHLSKMRVADVPKVHQKDHANLIAEFEKDIEEAKIGLMGSNIVVGKDQHEIAVKANRDYAALKAAD